MVTASTAKLEGVDHHLIGLGDGLQGASGIAVLTTGPAATGGASTLWGGLGVTIGRRGLGGIRGVLLLAAFKFGDTLFQPVYLGQ